MDPHRARRICVADGMQLQMDSGPPPLVEHVRGMHQEIEDLPRVDAIYVKGGPKFDHCRGRPAILSIVS